VNKMCSENVCKCNVEKGDCSVDQCIVSDYVKYFDLAQNTLFYECKLSSLRTFRVRERRFQKEKI